MGKEHGANVERLFGEHVQDALANLLRLDKSDLTNPAHVHQIDNAPAMLAPQHGFALAADAKNIDNFALVQKRRDPDPRGAHNTAVETAAKAAITGRHNDQMGVVAPAPDQ